MTADLLQIALYAVLLVAIAWPLGHYVARVFTGETRFLIWLERPLLALAGQAEARAQRWSAYAFSLIAFNAAGFLLLFSDPALPAPPAAQSARV